MLTKEEFARKLARKGYTLKDARIIINDFIETVSECLVEKEGVHFVGFGTFFVKTFKGQTIKTVQGSEVTIDDYDMPRFKPATSIKRAVKEGFIRR